jgi:hypothetical protein
MKLYPKLFVVAGLALITSCNNSSTPKEAREDSSAVEEVDETAIAQQQIVSAFPSVYQFFSQQDTSFAPQKFVETQTDTLQAAPVLAINEKALKPYYPYLIYSPDSAYAIDLYSYNIVLVNRNNKTIGKAGGPDTEVGLVDVKNHTRKRIYFGGSSSAVLDAKWLNNQEFLVMTGEIIKDKAFSPVILKFSIPANTLQHFIYDDTLSVRPADYEDKRLPIQ